MTEITCAKCKLNVDIEKNDDENYSYKIKRADLGQCEIIRDKVAETGKADIRFLCPHLKKSIEDAVKKGVLSQLSKH